MKFDARKREQGTRLKPCERSRENIADTFKDGANAWKFNIERNIHRDRRGVVLERSLDDGERVNVGRGIVRKYGSDVRTSRLQRTDAADVESELYVKQMGSGIGRPDFTIDTRFACAKRDVGGRASAQGSWQ